MTQGIRAFTNARFVALLPQRAELGNKGFRRAVIDAAVAAFAISIASAATHYNHAFKTQKALDPNSVDGLGRAEDKKGGRKPKAVVVEAAPVAVVAPVAVETVSVIRVKTGEVIATGMTKADAEALVAKAAAAKKAKLAIAEAVTA